MPYFYKFTYTLAPHYTSLFVHMFLFSRSHIHSLRGSVG